MALLIFFLVFLHLCIFCMAHLFHMTVTRPEQGSVFRRGFFLFLVEEPFIEPLRGSYAEDSPQPLLKWSHPHLALIRLQASTEYCRKWRSSVLGPSSEDLTLWYVPHQESVDPSLLTDTPWPFVTLGQSPAKLKWLSWKNQSNKHHPHSRLMFYVQFPDWCTGSLIYYLIIFEYEKNLRTGCAATATQKEGWNPHLCR